MSFLDRIREANTHELSHFLPFRVAGERIGCVKREFAATLARWPGVFEVADAGVRLAPSLDAPGVPGEARTAAVAGVLHELREAGLVTGWRDELYPVTRRWADPPLFLIERAAVPLFGVRGYGVHMNGIVRRGDAVEMWVARRSLTKPTGPGKLDQLVAGGQPAGAGLRENVIKECWEEASIPAQTAAGVRAVGAVTYALETPEGFRPDMIYNFDLELPAQFTPVNTDGEVETFHLWPMKRVIETVRETDAFKFNCALVVIDFLVRHGFIAADEPEFGDIVEGLRGRPGPLPAGW